MFTNKLSNLITKPLVIFDLETTGVDPSTTEIVQFGALKITPKSKKPQSMKFLCKPKQSIPEEAIECHHITNEMVKHEKPFEYMIPEVAKFIQNCDFVGFNSNRFDVPILNRYLEQAKIYDIFDKAYLFDAMPLYRKHSSRTLSDAYRYYTGKKLEDAHDAMVDVMATAEILYEQLVKEDNPIHDVFCDLCPEPENRVGTTNHIICDDGQFVINFGKHKGTPMKQMDAGYLGWMIKKDFPRAVKRKIKEYI